MQGRLWEPFRIGRMELRNRIAMSAMVTRSGTDDGYITEQTRNHYEVRARGGTALIIVEGAYVHPRGRSLQNALGISDDKFIPGMSELVQAAHRHDTRIALQLHHGGREAKSTLTGMQPVAPSPLVGLCGETPEELKVGEIAEIVGFFAGATLRAKRAGFDGVELLGAHGYLIDQFLSPFSNKRQDSYGGDVPNRACFLLEVIAAVKKAVGEDYPVWVRMNGKEYGGDEGITLEDAQETARMAQNAGVAAIHVSAWGPTTPTHLTSAVFSPAVIADLAEGIKKVVTVPVIAVGRITPEAGERILEEGKADLIAIGKALLADPEFPNKIASKKVEDIKPCILCMECRNDLRSTEVTAIRCSVNAALGKEKESVIIPANKPRKILVVGGGPAGMEAARVAALRGHQVILMEEQSQLGGQLIMARVPPHKDQIGSLVEYFQAQLTKLGVQIVLDKKATIAVIDELSPEAVILATGAEPLVPKIPGLVGSHVVQAWDVLEGKVPVSGNVLIIGGGSVGCETAEFITGSATSVTVVEILSEMASNVGPSLRTFLLDRLKARGVTLLTRVICEEVIPGGIVITAQGEVQKTIKADVIVLAAGTKSNTKLHSEISGKVPEIYQIGDCIKPRKIRDAISEGYCAGSSI